MTFPQTNLSGAAFVAYQLNPAAGVISFVRSVFLGEPLQLLTIGYSVLGTSILLVFGLFLFSRLSARFSTVA